MRHANTIIVTGAGGLIGGEVVASPCRVGLDVVDEQAVLIPAIPREADDVALVQQLEAFQAGVLDDDASGRLDGHGFFNPFVTRRLPVSSMA